MKRFAIWLLAAGALALARPALATDVLTTVEIEKVAGVTGVRSVARGAAPGAGGDLNFTGADGKLLAMVVLDPGAFDALKRAFFLSEAKGVGDEAFFGPKGATLPYALYVRKGFRVASLATYFDRKGKPKLSAEQLAVLGRLLAARL